MLHVDRPSHTLPSPTDFPPAIQAALGRLAGRVGLCAQVSPRCRLLLAELLRCADHRKPQESIRVKNTSLASALGTSVRSVGNLKAELEDAGWIRRHQVQSRRRGMQVADIWFTRLALEAMGLGMGGIGVDNRGLRKSSNPQAKNMRRQKGTHACLFPQPFSKGHQAAPGEVEETHGTPLSPSEVEYLREMQAVWGQDLEGMEAEEVANWNGESPAAMVSANVESKVPDDLRLLIKLGLSEGAVFKLMGIATRMRCRLSHVVAVAGSAIAKADRVYSYVLALLKSKKDWARLAAQPTGVFNPQAAMPEVAGPKAISADDAGKLAPEAHSVIGNGCLVDAETGKAWYVQGGVIKEALLNTLAQDSSVACDIPTGGSGAGGESGSDWRGLSETNHDAYERLGRRLVRQAHDGRLKKCSRSEAVSIATSLKTSVETLRAECTQGRVVVKLESSLAWRYHLGRFEQSTLGARGQARWALQLSTAVELAVARDLARGAATLVAVDSLAELSCAPAVQGKGRIERKADAETPLGALFGSGFAIATGG